MGQLFTIGHSTHTVEHFLNLLKMNGIDYVLDVRSTPYSRYAEQFNRENIQNYLEQNDVKYSFMGKYFGARQDDPKLYHPDGYLDFEKTRQSAHFRKGQENVEKGLVNYNIALMCTEKSPLDCHRAIMVARAFELDGYIVNHVLEDGSIMSQEIFHEALMDMYFRDRNQITLFQMLSGHEENYLEESYRQRNKEIGYHLQQPN